MPSDSHHDGVEDLEKFADNPGWYGFNVACDWRDVARALERGGSPEFMQVCERIVHQSMPCTQAELDAATPNLDALVERKVETLKHVHEALKKIFNDN
jgi:hypothetical protein